MDYELDQRFSYDWYIPRQVLRTYYKKHLKGSRIPARKFYNLANKICTNNYKPWVDAMSLAAEQLKFDRMINE